MTGSTKEKTPCCGKDRAHESKFKNGSCKNYGYLTTLAVLASIGVSAALIVGKMAAWAWTGSATMLASLTDSAMDALGSIITLCAVRYALLPPDDNHRFGHGKAEAIAGLIQGAAIAATSVFVIIHGVERAISPVPVESPQVAIMITALSILLTGCLMLLQNKIIKLTGSTAVKADKMHIQADFLFNVGVLAAFILFALTDIAILDGIVASCLGLYILKGAWSIGFEATNILLDHCIPEDDFAEIERIVNSFEYKPHDLRARQSGNVYFVQMHVNLPADMLLKNAHQIADDMEDAIKEKFPTSDVQIHMEPV